MRNFIFAIILLEFSVGGFAQTQTTIFTPKGSSVPDTYIIPEFTSSQITSGNNYVAVNYPNAMRLTDASATYNCHGYAWHISEGGNNVWIGYSTVTAEDIYWNDGSYVEVCNQTFPAKVSYASDNHSAITTNQTDVFKSKWGQLPLMEHNKDYMPYNSSVLKYYGRISGPNLICTTGQFNIGTISGITWFSSNPSGLTIDANTGLATRVNNFNGRITVTAAINGGCGAANLTRDVYVGNYLPIGTSSYNSNCSGNTFNILNTSLSAACTANTPIHFSYKITDSNYSNFVYTPVSVPSGATWRFSGGNLYMTVTTPPSQGSRSATIALSATGSCGTYNVNFTSTAVNYYSGGYYYSSFPNPASETLTIEQTYNIEENSEVGTFLKERSFHTHYFRLYDFNNYKVVLKGSLSGKTEIDVSKLDRGRYILKIQIANDKEETHHVIIN